MSRQPQYTKPFQELRLADVPIVGGKNASLGEMIQFLAPKGIRVPDGFAVTADAYWRVLDASGLRQQIKTILHGLEATNVADLRKRGSVVRSLIRRAPFPEDVSAALAMAYAALSDGKKEVSVAVRSSATAEDLPGASFAGQQESFLNIRGIRSLEKAVRDCMASLFTDRAIAYREENGFEHTRVALSVGVQRMVRSDLACAGVMFTCDPESGFKDAVVINAAYGLGESVVQGRVNPDQYVVYKPFLGKAGLSPVLRRTCGAKERKMLYGTTHEAPTKTVLTTEKERNTFCLTEKEILQLAQWGKEIETYYSKRAKTWRPMDIEWAKDGEDGKLTIVQARPETVESKKDQQFLETYALKKTGTMLTFGLAVGAKIGSGTVRVIRRLSQMSTFQDGDVLVTEMTDPDWVPVMRRASAVVTERGGRTCHAAIVARELGTPTICGTGNATRVLKDGMKVTVSCAEGGEGRVYEGELPFEVTRRRITGLGVPKTHVMMNLAEPGQAFAKSFIPSSGVGLARTEFIFTNDIRVHPMAALHPEKIARASERKEMMTVTSSAATPAEYIVERLAEGIATIAAAFYPREVIVRTSDFKTNEYAQLLGGSAFEPKESNPMIGWRGAARYIDPNYREAFLLECRALKVVREKKGFTNVIPMIPFCRTPAEGRAVVALMSRAGLVQGKNGLQIYVMIEIPSNIILAEQFADIFDGFSIGSNDLTQLTLGVDRDSYLVSGVYDEQNEAVLESIRHVIRVAKKKKVKIGICGQAPSDHPEFAALLVREGIDSISLNPDTVLQTTLKILKAEKKKPLTKRG